MSRVLLVARREFVENIHTKSFWIGILIFPVILSLSILVPHLLEKTKDVRKYAVIDRSGWLLEAVEDRATYDDTARLLRFVQKKAKSGGRSFERMPEALKSLAAFVEGLSDEQLDQTARTVTALAEGFGGKDAGMAGAGMAALPEGQANEYLAWFTSLTPEEARGLNAEIRRGEYERLETPEGPADVEERLREQLEEGPDTLFAYFVINADPLAGDEAGKYVSKNRTDHDLKNWFTRLSNDEIRERRLAVEGIAPEVARRIEKKMDFSEKQLGEGGEEEKVEAADIIRQWAPVAFVYLLWVAIFTVSSMLLMNTVEEKSNRIIEVLLSSLSPMELLVGKVVGVAATGLTMVGSWVFFFILALRFGPSLLGAPGDLDLTLILREPVYLASFIVYFLLGYVLFSTFLVGVGSVFNSVKEVQNLQGPLVMILIIPLLAMVPIVRDPNGTLAKVMSFVPPFTPFVMMNRAAGPPAPWEYVVTTLLLLATIVLVAWASAKVFRIGILMTGKSPRLKEILRWIKAPVGAIPERETESRST